MKQKLWQSIFLVSFLYYYSYDDMLRHNIMLLMLYVKLNSVGNFSYTCKDDTLKNVMVSLR